MTNLVLINGCGGAGKETTSRALLGELGRGAWLDVKSLTKVEPWEFGGKVANLGIRNAAALINNFIEAGYDPVIYSGGLNSQEKLDSLDALVPPQHPRHYIWIDVSKDVRDARRVQRARDEGDKAKHLDHIDEVFTDPGELVVPNGRYYRIFPEGRSPSEIVAELIRRTGLDQDGDV